MTAVDTEAHVEEEASAIEAERPEWLPSQFEAPEALASSYRSAQQKITAQGQQLSELAAENSRLTEELEKLLEGRHVLADRISSLEQAFIAARTR
jgi:cell division protein FtsB